MLLLIAIGLLLTGIWYGTRAKALTLEQVDVVGGETISHADIMSVVDTELTGTYYRLVPKRFAWTYPEARIQERIANVPRVKNVLVDRTSGTKLSVIFEEYQPFALWCESVAAMQCLFLDRDGYAFAEAPHLAGGSFVRYVDSSVELGVGQSVFTPEFVRRTNEFITTAYDELGLNIVTVEKTNEQELQYHIAGGGRLRTSLLETYADTIENLATILGSEEFKHLEPGNFQYIDLRFGNKVFVNEEILLAPTPTGEGASSTATTTSDI